MVPMVGRHREKGAGQEGAGRPAEPVASNTAGMSWLTWTCSKTERDSSGGMAWVETLEMVVHSAGARGPDQHEEAHWERDLATSAPQLDEASRADAV